jgi:hypothetical protein
MLTRLWNSWVFAFFRDSWDQMTTSQKVFRMLLDFFLLWQTYEILFK